MIKMRIFWIFVMNVYSLSLIGENSHLEKVDYEIETLQKEIHEAALTKEKLEVNSQNYIKYEWAKYVDEIQKAEEYDNKILILEDKLKKLKEEKALLKKSIDESKL